MPLPTETLPLRGVPVRKFVRLEKEILPLAPLKEFPSKRMRT
jgi:hypothetical protein